MAFTWVKRSKLELRALLKDETYMIHLVRSRNSEIKSQQHYQRAMYAQGSQRVNLYNNMETCKKQESVKTVTHCTTNRRTKEQEM